MALCIKRNDILYVYETLSKDGCKLRHWKDFINYSWNLLYEKIVFRPLIVNAKSEVDHKLCNNSCTDLIDDIDNKIFEFIKITENKPYRLTCNKLFCYNTPKKYEKENDWSKCKGFYCSSLVAAAYMHSGIMKVEHGAGKFKPGNFSVKYDSKSSLSFNENFDLGSEFIVDFS